MKKLIFLFLIALLLLCSCKDQTEKMEILTELSTVKINPTITPVPSSASTTVKSTSTPVPSSTPITEISTSKKLLLANGLFSIKVKNLEEKNKNQRSFLADEYYIIDDYITIRANYAPINEYDETAHIKFNSMVSYYYAIHFSNNYSESAVTEETLLSGAKVIWQIMRDDNHKAIICEVLNNQFGYNFVIYSHNNEITSS